MVGIIPDMEEEWAAASGGDVVVRPGGRVDRLLQATTALARTLGTDNLAPIVAATVSEAQRLVEARVIVLLLEERGSLVVAGVAGDALPRRIPCASPPTAPRGGW